MTRRPFLKSLSALWSATLAARARAAPSPAQRLRLTLVLDDLPGEPPQPLWMDLPEGFAERPEPWPLLVFLHGSGERGSDLERVRVHGPPKWIDAGRREPLVLASPQLAEGQTWRPERLQAMLRALLRDARLDAGRCYATGLSLGGHGVWNWACAEPTQFAAVVPVCGHGDPARVAVLRDLPLRAYHGEADGVVPMARQQACIDALRAAGGRPEFIVYPGLGHNAWDPAYQDPELLPWLLAHRAPPPPNSSPSYRPPR